MHRHRGRPRWEDIEFREQMFERDMAYVHEHRRRMYAYNYGFDDEFEGYDSAYTLRMYELERQERVREWDMAHRERILMEDHAYQLERLAMGREDEILPSRPVAQEKCLPPPPVDSVDASEHLYTSGEQGDEDHESWNPDGGQINTEDESWMASRNEHTGQGEGQFPGSGWSLKDYQVHGEKTGEMDMEDEGDGRTMEEKQVLKAKRGIAIPPAYFGPNFHSEFNEFTIRVSPVTYFDTIKPCFSSITASASSVRINLGTKKDGTVFNSSLVLMTNSSNVKNLMRGIVIQNFTYEIFTVSVEQHAVEVHSDEEKPTVCPTVIHKASFKINNKAIRDHMNRITIAPDNSNEKQSTLSLHNLPKNVDWTFLRNLFPLSLKGQVIEGEPRSALILMEGSKMALIHMASISDLQIDGQYVHMTTDVPPTEAVQMLKEEEEEATPTNSMPKKKKKLSPSDIRRKLEKKAELEQRMAKNTPLPAAPPFPGIPRLMNMSFSGPGNTATPHAPRNSGSPAGMSDCSGPGVQGKAANKQTKTSTTMSGTNQASATKSSDFEVVPIPQIMEGPYPPASDYYAPGTTPSSGPDTNQRPRAGSYLRRNRARMAVYIAHLWGGDIAHAGKALARCALPEDERPPVVMAPPQMLSVEPLTDAQLRRLMKKVVGAVSLDDMRKAEQYWQRKQKGREAAGLSMVSQQSQAAMEDKEMVEDTSQQKPWASTPAQPQPFQAPAPQPFSPPSPQPFRAPAPQPFSPPSPQPFRAPAPKTFSQTWNQFSSSQDQSLMPPPPPPPPTLRPLPSPQPAPSTQSRFFQPPDQRPAQPGQNRFPHPPSPTAAQAPPPPRGQYSQHAPPQSAAPSSQAPFPNTQPPRPTSAPQNRNTQPAFSWKPGSVWGSASRPPAQVGQNRHRSPSMSHQQGSTSTWDRESQQQLQQAWSREPGGLPRTSGTNAGGQSYSPYTPQQYEGFWQRGGVLKDRQENASGSTTHSEFHWQ